MAFRVNKLAFILAAICIIVDAVACSKITVEVANVFAAIILIVGAFSVHLAIFPLALVSLPIFKTICALAISDTILLPTIVLALSKINLIQQMHVVQHAPITYIGLRHQIAHHFRQLMTLHI